MHSSPAPRALVVPAAAAIVVVMGAVVVVVVVGQLLQSTGHRVRANSLTPSLPLQVAGLNPSHVLGSSSSPQAARPPCAKTRDTHKSCTATRVARVSPAMPPRSCDPVGILGCRRTLTALVVWTPSRQRFIFYSIFIIQRKTLECR